MTGDLVTVVLAAAPEGKGRRQSASAIACAANVPLHDAAFALLRLHEEGTVGRMERDGRESWWKWPIEADGAPSSSDEAVSGQEAFDFLDATKADTGSDDAREEALDKLRDLIAPFVMGRDIDEQIDAINDFRAVLSEFSPMKGEPVDYVQWVPGDTVAANNYNPNSVAPPEMELLRLSIMADGYTQPIVATNEDGGWTVIDGFHRNRVGKECPDVRERIHGYLPVVGIRPDREDRGDRIASTIRHNRARGKHQVVAMSDIVLELKRRNWSDTKIGKELGMDPDEVLRLAQISGLADAFKDREFSKSWEADIDDLDDTVLAAVDEGSGTMTSDLDGDQ